MEDIWEPIRQGFKDIREGFKESRDYDIAKQKAETDRLEKAAKIADEQEKDQAKKDFIKAIGDEGSSVFGPNTRLAQAAAAAGVNLTTFKKDKPRKGSSSSGFDYSFLRGKNLANNTTTSSADDTEDQADPGDANGEEASGEDSGSQMSGGGGSASVGSTNMSAGATDATGIRSNASTQAPDLENYNFSNTSSMKALESTQKVLMDKQSLVNNALSEGTVGTPQQARAANQVLKGTQNLLKITNREISVRKEIDKNYKTAVDQLYKIDPGSASKVIDEFNNKVVPDLQKAGVPVDVIDGRKQQFVVNYLQNLKTSKNEVEALFKTAYNEADVFDKNFKENEKLYKFAAVADKDTLQKMIKDPNIKPYQQNVLISALMTKMMQDQVNAKTGQNMSVLSDDQIEQLYTPATPANQSSNLNVDDISQAGSRIRGSFQKQKQSPIRGRPGAMPSQGMTTQPQQGFSPIRR